ncbi:MAG TPA: hypothetical protein VN577_23235 [Terriglobales bacterium]|nr:hypothetical protein [Terriglobales bacterium]
MPVSAGKETTSHQLPSWLLRAALIITFLVYVRTVAFDFVYDDHYQISLNAWLHDWRLIPQYFTHQLWAFRDLSSPANFYRPMFSVWLAAVYHLTGGAPGWYHMATILLHLIVVMEAYVLARLLLQDRLAAAIAAALFALHPSKVEAVAWVSGGGEPLFAAFFFATFILYWKGRESGSWAVRSASVITFLAALFTKEQALVAPFIIGIFEIASHRQESWRMRLWKATRVVLPYFIVFAAFWLARMQVMKGVGDGLPGLSLSSTLWTQPIAWLWYIGHVVFPFNLSMIYPRMIVRGFSVVWVLLPAIALAFLGIAAWLWARKSPRGVMLLAWFILTLAPPVAMILLVQPHDRYLYLPTFAVAVGLAGVLRRLPPRWQVLVAACLCAIFATGSFYESRYWDSDLSLMQRAVERAPSNPYSHLLLSVAYGQQGDLARAKKILVNAADRFPHEFDIWQALGIQEYSAGNYDEAYAALTRAANEAGKGQLQLPAVWFHLGLVCQKLGRAEESERWYRQAIAADANRAVYHAGLASLLESAGRTDEALAERNLAQQLRQQISTAALRP